MPATSRTSSESPLDAWLPDADAEVDERRPCEAAPERLWAAAERVEIGEAGLLRPLIALRLGSYAPSTETTFREVLRAPPFVLLDEGERWSISGLAGRLWAPDADFAALTTAEQFRAFAEPGLAKVAMLVRVLPREASRSEIEVLARVWCTSDEARARFAPLWALVAPFARLIPGQALEPAVRAAEDDE